MAERGNKSVGYITIGIQKDDKPIPINDIFNYRLPIGSYVRIRFKRQGQKSQFSKCEANSIRAFKGTVIANEKLYIRVMVDCPLGRSYICTVQKVDILTGYAVVENKGA